MARGGVRDLFGCPRCHLSAQLRVFFYLHFDGCGNFLKHAAGFLFLLPQERIEKPGIADIVTQFAVLEKDVHGFPKRVIEDLDHLLVLKGSVPGRCRHKTHVRPARANVIACRARRRSSADCTSGSPSGGPKPITISSGFVRSRGAKDRREWTDRAPAERVCRR